MKIILASTSPRRIQLLKQAGIRFTVRAPQTDELEIHGESPRKMVARLALEKAQAVAKTVPSKTRALILAADTTVVGPAGTRFADKVMGKPTSRKQALQMVGALAGRTHWVLTGYCLVDSNDRILKRKVVRTRVKMRVLNSQEVQHYVDSGESMDKAGGYAAQGVGMTLIQAIQGSYTNVVGLPMAEVLADLKKITHGSIVN